MERRSIPSTGLGTLRQSEASTRDLGDLEKMNPNLRIDPQAVRAGYLERIGKFVKTIEAACGNLRADYVPVNTSKPLRETLLRYLGRRMHSRRGS